MINCQAVGGHFRDMHRRYRAVLARALLSASIMLCGAPILEAATLTSTSCSRADVGDAVNRANSGDTVLIPSGHCSWTTNLKITGKYLTLQGAGIDKTIIVDEVSKAGYPNIPQVIWWNSIEGGVSRLSGITFQGGSTLDSNNKGIIAFEGSSHSFRIDHNKFVPTQTAGLIVRGNLWGVIDHNIFDMSAQKGYGIYVHGEGFGDRAWTEESTLGTEQNVFIEDNLFTQDRTKGFFYEAIDGWTGHRIVVRYNQFEAVKVANHGTETSGRARSARQYEYYNNTWIWDMYSSATPTIKKNGYPALIAIRGGTGVIFNNRATITNGSVPHIADFQYYRISKSYTPWGQCPNIWDLNLTRCLDQPGVGQGALLSGASPTPQGWPHQIDAPAHVWNNQINDVLAIAISNVPSVVQEGRDFFSKPMPGYTPYVYPHPLVNESPRSPTPIASPKLTIH